MKLTSLSAAYKNNKNASYGWEIQLAIRSKKHSLSSTRRRRTTYLEAISSRIVFSAYAFTSRARLFSIYTSQLKIRICIYSPVIRNSGSPGLRTVTVKKLLQQGHRNLANIYKFSIPLCDKTQEGQLEVFFCYIVLAFRRFVLLTDRFDTLNVK